MWVKSPAPKSKSVECIWPQNKSRKRYRVLRGHYYSMLVTDWMFFWLTSRQKSLPKLPNQPDDQRWWLVAGPLGTIKGITMTELVKKNHKIKDVQGHGWTETLNLDSAVPYARQLAKIILKLFGGILLGTIVMENDSPVCMNVPRPLLEFGACSPSISCQLSSHFSTFLLCGM